MQENCIKSNPVQDRFSNLAAWGARKTVGVDTQKIVQTSMNIFFIQISRYFSKFTATCWWDRPTEKVRSHFFGGSIPPASCGKFAEISRDLYKKYIHRCLDYFLRVNSNSFPRTSGCQVWETVLDRIGFDTIFLHDFLIKFQTLTFSEVTFSAICERSQRHKNPQAMTFYNRIRNSSSTYRSEMSEMTEWHFRSFQCLFSNSAMTFAE